MHPRTRPGRWIAALVAVAAMGCASRSPNPATTAGAGQPAAPACDVAAASPWIEKWLGAWELASRGILRIPDAPAPEIVLFDNSCVYTTSAVSAGGRPAMTGPALGETPLPWRAFAHGGTIKLPDSSEAPIQLTSFSNATPEGEPFFVMSAPAIWAEKGHGEEDGPIGVFLHEFAHTRQFGGMRARIGPLDASWPYPEELDDDAVQKHFSEDAEYVAVYTAERDLLYRAADAATLPEARELAKEALAMMRSRRARWFTGDKALFAEVEDVFLSLEGSAQWTAYAWLAHPQGGGLDRQAAITKMLGRRRWWTQDEGLALLLVVDRLLPDWPSLVFGEASTGSLDLLERAVSSVPPQ